MEFLNKVEIVGVVGDFQRHTLRDVAVDRISVATQKARRSEDFGLVVDCTWFQVVRNCDENTEPLTKGDWVHVVGSFRVRRYATARGQDRVSYEVEAESITVMEEK